HFRSIESTALPVVQIAEVTRAVIAGWRAFEDVAILVVSRQAEPKGVSLQTIVSLARSAREECTCFVILVNHTGVKFVEVCPGFPSQPVTGSAVRREIALVGAINEYGSAKFFCIAGG